VKLISLSTLCLAIPLSVFAKDAAAPGVYANIYTSKGKIVCKLEFEKAPLTVTNFVGLAEGTKTHSRNESKRFYDGLTFHRVEPNFVIQGGDPAGNGSGGPGYQFQNEVRPDLKHDKAGTLAMANAGPNTNGSQFYITLAPTPFLDGNYNVFGYTTEGMDVVKAIKVGDKIDSVRITRIGAKAKAFKATDESFQTIIQKGKSAETAKQKKAEADFHKLEKKAITTKSGLKYIVTQVGSGPKPAKGVSIKVHYTGTLVDGTKFDSSRDRNQPFDFAVGTGQVIAGWDEALLDMQKGERRTLIIPPNLAYGPEGRPPVIPANATLIFDVELLDF
jgi:FKBP-type peptidyl-prolyl cis-trans isomerase